MSGTIAPIQELTPNNRGPIATVSIFVCVFTLAAAIGARVWITVTRKIKISTDDVLFLFAAVFAVASSACLEKQVNKGLGRHWSKLSSQDRIDFLKLGYAAQILSIVAMGFAKMSVTLLYQRIASFGRRYYHYALFAMVGLWTVFALFAVSFACGLPNPWNHLPSNCSVQFSLDYVVISLNALTDAVLALAFLPVLWKLNTNKNRRVTAMGLFASRLLVSIAAIGQLVVYIIMKKNSDPSWEMVPRAILDSVVVYTSLITACLPRIHTFLNIQTGQMGTAIPDRELFLSNRSKNGSKTSKSKSANTSKNSGGPSMKASKPSKSLFGTSSKGPKTNGRPLNSNSEISLCRVQNSNHSHDANSVPEDMTTPLQLRPPAEPKNTYHTRCFSDNRQGGAISRSTHDHEDEENSMSNLKNGAVFQTRDFQIEYPNSAKGSDTSHS